jgi:hypothetical protein
MYFHSQKKLALRYRLEISGAIGVLYEEILECTVDIREILSTQKLITTIILTFVKMSPTKSP